MNALNYIQAAIIIVLALDAVIYRKRLEKKLKDELR